MRVTAAVPLYPPKSRVGAWLASANFLSALAARGHRVDVVPNFPRDTSEQYELDGVTVYPSRYRDACCRRSDVVISHLGDGNQAHRVAKGMNIPSVKMIHGGIIQASALQGVDLAICNSYASAAYLGPWEGKRIVCHPPTDPEEFRTEPGDHITLVNLSAEKGGDLFWKLARSVPDQKFLGVKGGYGQQVNGRAKNVETIDQTANMRDEVYARTRVLLMPSRHETWGMTAIEAMYSGIPVLARPTPGLRESLGIAANWVPSYDIGQWSLALSELLENWDEASARALKRVESLDPEAEKTRFIEAIEALGPKKRSETV